MERPENYINPPGRGGAECFYYYRSSRGIIGTHRVDGPAYSYKNFYKQGDVMYIFYIEDIPLCDVYYSTPEHMKRGMYQLECRLRPL